MVPEQDNADGAPLGWGARRWVNAFVAVPVGLQYCDRCLGARFRTTPMVEFGT